MLYGNLPKIVKNVDFDCSEMMFWLYLPIKMKNSYDVKIPKNIDTKFRQFIDLCCQDFSYFYNCGFYDYYLYLTVKTMFVDQNNLPNRPGWHSDGFMTNDINYIWSNNNPTIFWKPEQLVNFTQDHDKSLLEMEKLCESSGELITYPEKTILRLDQTVIHKVNPNISPGFRTFLKLSFSKSRYNLVGNSINYELEYPDDWIFVERKQTRNCPIGRN